MRVGLGCFWSFCFLFHCVPTFLNEINFGELVPLDLVNDPFCYGLLHAKCLLKKPCYVHYVANATLVNTK